METTLRIAVCNVQSGIGTTRGYWQYLTTGWKYLLPHGSRPLKKAAAFLRTDDIDIATFCEVEGGSRRSRGVDQVGLVSAETPLVHRAFFPTLVIGSRVNQGNGLCSRFPVRPVRNHPLPGAGEPRFLSEAEIQIGDVAIRLFITHLSLERKLRSPQIEHLAEKLRQRRRPTILAGDFNISADAELDLLSEGGLQQAASAPTFPSWKPSKRLDHLFVSEHFTLHSPETFDRFLFADHLPLVATVELR